MTAALPRLAATLVLFLATASGRALATDPNLEKLEELDRILSRPVPVYPGSQLDFEEADPRFCCAFQSRDPVGKITAFYEKAMKARVLDLAGLKKAFPDVAKGEAFPKQLPPGFTLHYVVLADLQEGGRRALDAIEVACAGGTCRYNFAEKRLLPADQRYAAEWRAHFAAAPPAGRGVGAQLGRALPLVELPGFRRLPVDVSEGEAPQARVRWEQDAKKAGPEGDSGELSWFELSIADTKGQPFSAAEFLSTEGNTGLRKVKVNGSWPGVEFVDGPRDGLYSAERRFVVQERFAAELTSDGRGDPRATLDRLCKELKVEALPH